MVRRSCRGRRWGARGRPHLDQRDCSHALGGNSQDAREVRLGDGRGGSGAAALGPDRFELRFGAEQLESGCRSLDDEPLRAPALLLQFRFARALRCPSVARSEHAQVRFDHREDRLGVGHVRAGVGTRDLRAGSVDARAPGATVEHGPSQRQSALRQSASEGGG